MSGQTQKPPLAAVRWEGRAAVVEVNGEIDVSSSGELQSELLSLLAEKPMRIVVDLSSVPYMDSAGIASLVKLLGRGRKASVPVRLANLQQRVRSMFEITRLDKVFEIFADVREALGE